MLPSLQILFKLPVNASGFPCILAPGERHCSSEVIYCVTSATRQSCQLHLSLGLTQEAFLPDRTWPEWGQSLFKTTLVFVPWVPPAPLQSHLNAPQCDPPTQINFPDAPKGTRKSTATSHNFGLYAQGGRTMRRMRKPHCAVRTPGLEFHLSLCWDAIAGKLRPALALTSHLGNRDNGTACLLMPLWESQHLMYGRSSLRCFAYSGWRWRIGSYYSNLGEQRLTGHLLAPATVLGRW